MNKIKFNISIKLIKDEFSPQESAPQMRIFLDARFDRKSKITQMNANNINIDGEISNRITQLPQTTSLVFSAFAVRKNDSGSNCLMDVGVNRIPIQSIVNNKTKTYDLSLLMNTVDNYEKGVIRVTINSFEMKNIKIIDKTFLGDGLMRYINDTIETEQKMQDTVPGTSNMRIPYDYSESGIMMSGGTPMPAVAYVMSETPSSNLRFWENNYITVMQREDMDPEDWVHLDDTQKARIMALMCCYVSQYLDYISDTIDKNTKRKQYIRALVVGCENFGDCLTTGSGDCEDLGTGILQCFNALLAFKFPKKTILSEIQTLARQYIPLLSLDAVNGAQVSDENAPKGAHMNDNLIPIHQFRAMMRTTPEGVLLDKRVSGLYPTNINENLPFMIGEGTGKLEPLGCDNIVAQAMSYVYQTRSLSNFKKPIPRKKGEQGTFLVASLTGMTDYFIKNGINIGSLWYTTVQNNGTTTRGSYYSDMINDRKNVGILMHEKIPKKDMDVIKEAVMTRDPPQPLVLTKKHDYKHEKNIHLDYVVEYIAKLNRSPGENLQNRVPVYVRPHQINSSIAGNMAIEFGKLEKIWKVEYNLERVTDEIWGYEMRIYVQ
ncbi:hypothetical protein OAB94_02715 [Flavobacteriaceae bacterium]|nr:hypothetical protein [Flavobacteriaceae bacterium]